MTPGLQDIGNRLSAATKALAQADAELKWELAGAVADAAGLVDPTPVSDLVGAGLSLRKGDFLGAGLSAASVVPYVGDAAAKPIKAARATKSIAALEKKVATLTKTVNDLKKAKKQAEAAEATAKEAKIAKEADAAKEAAEQQGKATAKKGKDCENCELARKKTVKTMPKASTPCFSAKNLGAAKSKEFSRQLNRQEDALNKLTVKQYMDARAYFSANKRTGTGAAQKAAREDYSKKLIQQLLKKYRKQGLSQAEAVKAAKDEATTTMKSLAALHEPDMIAGGKDIVTEMGDKSVNSSIGSQWRSRVGSLDEAAKSIPLEERASTTMNVNLPQCK